MLSKPYKRGDNWRIDIVEEGHKYYVEFESYEEAWVYYDYNVESEPD